MNRFAPLLSAGALAIGAPTFAAVGYDTAGAVYHQTFDTLAASGDANPWTNDATLSGWYIFNSRAFSSDTGRRASVPDNVAPANWVAPQPYLADDDALIRSRVYSFGADGSTDRALGSYTTASLNAESAFNPGDFLFALVLQNTTGSTLTEFTLSYTGEQWKQHTNTNLDGFLFSYLVKSGFDAQSDIPTQSTFNPYTRVDGLDFDAPVNMQAEGPLDGNAAGNRLAISHTVTGLNWADGEYLILRWLDNDVAGEDVGVALEDVQFSAIPEPATGLLVGALALCGLARRRA